MHPHFEARAIRTKPGWWSVLMREDGRLHHVFICARGDPATAVRRVVSGGARSVRDARRLAVAMAIQ